jgi:hypothetical protein
MTVSGIFCEEMRGHVKGLLTRSERPATNCDGSSRPAGVISFWHGTVIQYGVSVQESSPSYAWMDRQPHPTRVSYCSLVTLMGQAASLHCNGPEWTNGSPRTERQT